MLSRNRWKELLLSLAAGQSMVPLGDNGAPVRKLSRQIWALRAAEAGRAAGPAARLSSRWSVRDAKQACRV